jgi:hypothetical protein
MTDTTADACTAYIVNEHSGGTHHCALEAGHHDPEFGTDHAGPVDDNGVRYRWGDDAIGAVPHAASAVVPAADRAALRDRIAEALMQWAERNNNPQYASMRRSETVRANAYSRADAIMPVLPAPADRAAVLEEAADAVAADTGFHIRYGAAIDYAEHYAALLRRLAVESAVVDRVAAETPPAETLRPAATEWTFEACYDADNDKWHGIGGTYRDRAEAKDAFKHRAENDSGHVKHFKFRLVRATTTYAVEAERPVVVAQPGKDTETRVVAHVLATHTDLHCLNCAPPPHGDVWTPVTADDLDDGGVCVRCGVDVLIPQQPKEA